MMKFKANFIVFVLYMTGFNCGIINNNSAHLSKEKMVDNEKTREGRAEDTVNYSGGRSEVNKRVSEKALSIHDPNAVETLGPFSTSKQKRFCRVGAIHGFNNEDIVGASPPVETYMSEKQTLLNNKLCNTCKNRSPCKTHNKCEYCRRWCTAGEIPSTISPKEIYNKMIDSTSDNLKSTAVQGLTFGNRFGETGENEKVEMKRLHAIANMKSGKLKEIICRFLGVSNPSDIDTLVVLVTTISNKPPKFFSDYKKLVTTDIEQLTGKINEELDKALKRKKEQGLKFLTHEEIEQIINNILTKGNQSSNREIVKDPTVNKILPPYPIDQGSDEEVKSSLNPPVIEDMLNINLQNTNQEKPTETLKEPKIAAEKEISNDAFNFAKGIDEKVPVVQQEIETNRSKMNNQIPLENRVGNPLISSPNINEVVQGAEKEIESETSKTSSQRPLSNKIDDLAASSSNINEVVIEPEGKKVDPAKALKTFKEVKLPAILASLQNRMEKYKTKTGLDKSNTSETTEGLEKGELGAPVEENNEKISLPNLTKKVTTTEPLGVQEFKKKFKSNEETNDNDVGMSENVEYKVLPEQRLKPEEKVTGTSVNQRESESPRLYPVYIPERKKLFENKTPHKMDSTLQMKDTLLPKPFKPKSVEDGQGNRQIDTRVENEMSQTNFNKKDLLSESTPKEVNNLEKESEPPLTTTGQNQSSSNSAASNKVQSFLNKIKERVAQNKENLQRTNNVKLNGQNKITDFPNVQKSSNEIETRSGAASWKKNIENEKLEEPSPEIQDSQTTTVNTPTDKSYTEDEPSAKVKAQALFDKLKERVAQSRQNLQSISNSRATLKENKDSNIQIGDQQQDDGNENDLRKSPSLLSRTNKDTVLESPPSTITFEKNTISNRPAINSLSESNNQETAKKVIDVLKNVPQYVLNKAEETLHVLESEEKKFSQSSQPNIPTLGKQQFSTKPDRDEFLDSRNYKHTPIIHERTNINSDQDQIIESPSINEDEIKDPEDDSLQFTTCNHLPQATSEISINEDDLPEEDFPVEQHESVLGETHIREPEDKVSNVNTPNLKTDVALSNNVALEQPPVSSALGKLISPENIIPPIHPKDIYFIGNGIKLPLQMVQKEDGALHLSVDLDKLCSCNNITCSGNQKAVEETVGTILEKGAELEAQLSPNKDRTYLENGLNEESSDVAQRRISPSTTTSSKLKKTQNEDNEKSELIHRNEREIDDNKFMQMENTITSSLITKSPSDEMLNIKKEKDQIPQPTITSPETKPSLNVLNTNEINPKNINTGHDEKSKVSLGQQLSVLNTNEINPKNINIGHDEKSKVSLGQQNALNTNSFVEFFNKRLTELKSKMTSMQEKNWPKSDISFHPQEKWKNMISGFLNKSDQKSVQNKEPVKIKEGTWGDYLARTFLKPKEGQSNSSSNIIKNRTLLPFEQTSSKKETSVSNETKPIKVTDQIKKQIQNLGNNVNSFVDKTFKVNNNQVISKDATKSQKTATPKEVDIMNNVLKWFKNIATSKEKNS